MGSLFYINVPIREHEVFLRQRDLQITVNKEVDNKKDILAATAVRRSSLKAESDGTESVRGLVSKGSTNSVDVYEGTVEGRKANIVVSQDSMAIYTHDELKAESKTFKSADQTDRDLEKMQSAINNTFLEKHLEECLNKFQIYDATWGQSVDGTFSQISFTVNANRSEKIITFMISLGIGIKYESTLSVCSAIVYYNPHSGEYDKKGNEDGGDQRDSFGKQFMASIKSRLTVAQVVQTVQSNAVMTFDYIVLILIAGMIAALGLLESSSVCLVASMLISPLMGPIMAGCFGTVVRDTTLIKTGLISELVGLFLCLLVGFTFGVSVTWAPFPGPWDKLDVWPTTEMMARGRLKGIVVGAMVAIPSGAGVALSILAGNAGSLVGVAISASLLPPAVNCGMFWGMACTIAIKEHVLGHSSSGYPCVSRVPNQNHYKKGIPRPEYCEDVIREFALLGIVSFALTMVNIVLILLVGFMILKLKEVAPHTTRQAMSRFWKEDLKVMRDYNKSHGTFNKQALLNEISESNDSEGIRAKLANDHVFNQVARKTLFGGSGNILDAGSGDNNPANGPRTKPDVEIGEAGQEKQSKGFWGGIGSIFGGGSRKPSSLDVREIERKPSTSNRPKLAKTVSKRSIKRSKL